MRNLVREDLVREDLVREDLGMESHVCKLSLVLNLKKCVFGQ
jgi:hypothetical protein